MSRADGAAVSEVNVTQRCEERLVETERLLRLRDDRGRAAVSAADTLRAGGAELRGVVVV